MSTLFNHYVAELNAAQTIGEVSEVRQEVRGDGRLTAAQRAELITRANNRDAEICRQYTGKTLS